MKVHIFFSPKETKSISTAILSHAANFMLQRIENEYLAVNLNLCVVTDRLSTRDIKGD